MYYFSIFFKKFNKQCVNFCAFGRKTQSVGNFEKIFENFHKNIAKNELSLHIFHKNLANHALIFRAFGRKKEIVGTF